MKKYKLSGKEELFFEESVFDSHSRIEEFGSIELPLSKRAFILMLVGVIVAVILVFSRIFFLTGWRGDFYKARAGVNVGREVYESSPRGLIYDRFGTVLAENISSFSVTIKPTELIGEEGRNVIKELSKICEISTLDINNQIKNFNLEKNSVFVLVRNVEQDKIIQLKALNLKGVEIVSDYKRFYNNGEIFSSILGYVGVNERSNEIIEGKTGLEAYYNDSLKGIDGKTIVYKDALGNILDKKNFELSRVGNNLNTAIDAELQEKFYNVLLDQLNVLGRKVGVAIAMNPQNGEILSLINIPSYDNNIFSTSGNNAAKLKLFNSSDKPMFNRAISGIYTPGSTIKPMVGIAALKEGVVTSQTKVFSAGFIDIPNPYDPEHPSRFLDWKPHGWVDLHSALARSSNIYFYAVGGGLGDIRGLGIEKLKEYWKLFGYGSKTGIDLVGEKEGFLPDPGEKEKRRGDIWRVGDTYNVSIGQGDFMVTPLQLIAQTASIANGGKYYKPHLLKDANSEVLYDYTNLSSYIKEVQIGMEDTVSKSYGTAYSIDGLPVKIAAKTGSSQVANNTKTNAFFVGYMPAENPQIAILILIENAREGGLNAVPIAKDVFEWYYYNRIQSKQIIDKK